MLKSVLRFFRRPVEPRELVGDWLLTDRYQTYLEDPTPENYLRLRKLVLNDKAYRASSTGLDDIQMLIESARYGDARGRLQAMSPGWLLSPRAHQLAAEVARVLGDKEAERRERLLVERCIEVVLGTGEGTQNAPYLVTHPGDEYDLVDHFGRKVAGQALEVHDGRSLERVECQDGSALWFDLTELHARLDEPPKLSRPARRPYAR